jgi:hypothetical protein
MTFCPEGPTENNCIYFRQHSFCIDTLHDNYLLHNIYIYIYNCISATCFGLSAIIRYAHSLLAVLLTSYTGQGVSSVANSDCAYLTMAERPKTCSIRYICRI